MSDAATNFARGAELQSSLMARVVQTNIAQQQAEQQRAMLPLRLQSMEVKNEMNRLRITAQGYKNQVDAAKVSDQETLAGGLAALASGRDPGQLTLKTPEANSAWLNAKAHSAVGRTLASVTENFVNRVSAKGLPPDLVSKALAYPKGPDGTIAPEAWKALDMAETVAAQQASAERNAAEKSRSDLRMGEDKARIELQNEGRLDAVVSRALLTGGKATTPNSAADKAAFAVKKASFLRQVDVIKADQGLTSSQKISRIEEMQAKFEAEVAAMGGATESQPAATSAAPAPSGGAQAAAGSTSATGLVVKQGGAVVRDGKVAYTPPGLAASSNQPLVSEALVAAPQPVAAATTTEANLPADHKAVKDPVATAFWTTVADKLGVQPESVGFTRIQKAPRSVAKDDPRVKKYYESLPDETKQAIIDEAIKRARENPKDFMPDFFDYFLAPR